MFLGVRLWPRRSGRSSRIVPISTDKVRQRWDRFPGPCGTGSGLQNIGPRSSRRRHNSYSQPERGDRETKRRVILPARPIHALFGPQQKVAIKVVFVSLIGIELKGAPGRGLPLQPHPKNKTRAVYTEELTHLNYGIRQDSGTSTFTEIGGKTDISQIEPPDHTATAMLLPGSAAARR
jgi:hypothetical protein